VGLWSVPEAETEFIFFSVIPAKAGTQFSMR
jgi:hypothetical protein